MAMAAMKAGKYAGVEVPAAVTLENCWELVNSSEQIGVPCILLKKIASGRRADGAESRRAGRAQRDRPLRGKIPARDPRGHPPQQSVILAHTPTLKRTYPLSLTRRSDSVVAAEAASCTLPC